MRTLFLAVVMFALLIFVAAPTTNNSIAGTAPLAGCDSPLVDGHTQSGAAPQNFCPDGKPLLDGHTFPLGSVGSDTCPFDGYLLIEGRTTAGS